MSTLEKELNELVDYLNENYNQDSDNYNIIFGSKPGIIEYNEGNSGEPRGVVRRGRSALGAGIHPKPGAFLAPVQCARAGGGPGRDRAAAGADEVYLDLYQQPG